MGSERDGGPGCAESQRRHQSQDARSGRSAQVQSHWSGHWSGAAGVASYSDAAAVGICAQAHQAHQSTQPEKNYASTRALPQERQNPYILINWIVNQSSNISVPIFRPVNILFLTLVLFHRYKFTSKNNQTDPGFDWTSQNEGFPVVPPPPFKKNVCWLWHFVYVYSVYLAVTGSTELLLACLQLEESLLINRRIKWVVAGRTWAIWATHHSSV